MRFSVERIERIELKKFYFYRFLKAMINAKKNLLHFFHEVFPSLMYIFFPQSKIYLILVAGARQQLVQRKRGNTYLLSTIFVPSGS